MLDQKNTPPKTVMLLLTEECNLKCTYCYENHCKGREMTKETALTDVCDLSSCDVVISVSHPIKGYKNHVGAATYAAICSRILNENYNFKKSCFIGGCDLNGSLFWDDNDLSAVLRAMKENRMEILYAPLGTGRLMNFADCSDCSNGIAVVEAVNAEMLVRLAINAIDT